MMSKRQVIVFRMKNRYWYNVDGIRSIRISSPYLFRRSAEKAAKEEAKRLKCKYVGFKELL